VAGDNSPTVLVMVVSHLAMRRDSLQNPATPVRAFLLAVSFGWKSRGLFKVPAPLEKMKPSCKRPRSSQPRNTSASAVLSPGSMLGQTASEREVFGKRQPVLNCSLIFF